MLSAWRFAVRRATAWMTGENLKAAAILAARPDLASYTADQRLARGEQATALLQAPLLVQTFEVLERTYLDAIIETKPDAHADRERLYMAIHLARGVRKHLETIARAGALTQAELKDVTDEAAATVNVRRRLASSIDPSGHRAA